MRKRENQTETESEGRKLREGWGGGEFSKGLTARPLQLLHYWSSAKREQGQYPRKKEHTHRQLRTSAHKQDRAGPHSRPAAFRIWWSKDFFFFFFPCSDFYLLLSARQVSGEWISTGIVEARHTGFLQQKKENIMSRITSTPFMWAEFYKRIKKIYTDQPQHSNHWHMK